MDQHVSDGAAQPPARGWPRAAALFGVVLVVGVLRPAVLVAVPLLIFLAFDGLRSVPVVVAAMLALLIVASGPRDGLWYAERAWSVLMGGGFLALTMLVPRWRLSSRALGAVLGAGAVAAGVLAFRSEAWMALDLAISDGVRAGFDRTLTVMSRLSRNGLPSDFETSVVQIAEAQASVYPALLGVGSMAALAVAWWVRTRLVGRGDQAIGPLTSFRFNDHLVWLLVAGMLLLIFQWGDTVARLGSNAVVFMGALYALRGIAVFIFVNGGLSLFGYLLFFVGLVLAAPVLFGVAMLIGIGDTWLDIRSRASEGSA